MEISMYAIRQIIVYEMRSCEWQNALRFRANNYNNSYTKLSIRHSRNFYVIKQGKKTIRAHTHTTC